MIFDTPWSKHPEFEEALTDLLVEWAHTPDDEEPFPWSWTATWPQWAWKAYGRFKKRVTQDIEFKGLFGIDTAGARPLGGWTSFYDTLLAELHAGMVTHDV